MTIEVECFLEQLRKTIPAKSRNLKKSSQNKITPCWRTNKTVEKKSLQKLFTRHSANTEIKKRLLLDDILKNYQKIVAIRKTMLDENEFLSQPRMLSVWLNQDGWLDEFEDDEPPKTKTKQLCYCCGLPGTMRLENGKLVCRKEFEKSDPWFLQVKV